jgi:FkbH-like protein
MSRSAFIHELPWLPVPTDVERAALRQPLTDGGMAYANQLMQIAERRWDGSEMGSIGRKLIKVVRQAGEEWRQQAKAAGLVPINLLIFSSGTMAHMVDVISAMALSRGILLNCQMVEYQEPEAWLAQNGSALQDKSIDVVLVSLDANALRLDASPGNAAEAEAVIHAATDRLAGIADRLAKLTGASVVLENLAGDAQYSQSNADTWLAGSRRMMTATVNRRLASLKSSSAFLLLDVAGMAELVGLDRWDAGRHGFTAGMAFSPDCVPLYAWRFATQLASLLGKSRRVLVLDLDNTVWGGVIGDDGLEGIVLGGSAALGKAHIAIQKMAQDYAGRGILLCVASKNVPEIALDAFRGHPEMILRESDVTLFEINWESKANSIRNMARTLNLGTEAFVFLDDNPVERKQVRDALPGVAVPELPTDPTLWLPVFQAAGYFEQQSASEEDRKRTGYYKANMQRAALQGSVADEGAFLESLKMVMSVAPFDAVGRKRIAQLIAKSNQFNLTTRRYSETHIAELEADQGSETLQIRLTDIFGDNGMISVVICRTHGHSWEIDTWLMSCRVLGRGVEQATLNIVAERASASGAAELLGRFIPTPKNGIVKDHYEKLGFIKVRELENGETEWKMSLANYAPRTVPIQIVEAQRS